MKTCEHCLNSRLLPYNIDGVSVLGKHHGRHFVCREIVRNAREKGKITDEYKRMAFMLTLCGKQYAEKCKHYEPYQAGTLPGWEHATHDYTMLVANIERSVGDMEGHK